MLGLNDSWQLVAPEMVPEETSARLRVPGFAFFFFGRSAYPTDC